MSASRAPVDGAAPAGDGFALFLREQREPLRAFLRARGASEEDAEDIVQDCMERLIRYRGHPHTELKLLLYRIARNRLADRGRSPLAAPHLPLAEQDLPTEAPFTTPGPLRQAESGQMLNALRQALLKLPERCREVYLLNRITGMSYSQIARHRGITAKTVEKHVARALQGLRRELGADAFGAGGDE
nr:sigma-70 family RNA polymerase sigma factor [Stenotrophomonas sp.]